MSDKGPAWQRWTIEMGDDPELGEDCAIDVYIPNTYENERLLSTLVGRGSLGASVVYVDKIKENA